MRSLPPLAALVALFVFVPLVLNALSREPVRSKKGMVVSASPIASKVGAEILERGGNAVDAAVAVAFALAVTYPTAGNIGGGGFMVIHDATTGKDVAIDYREKASARAHRDMYLDANGDVIDGLSTNRHLAVAVPGTPAGLLLALDRYGTLDRATVMAPAIELAAEGFTVGFHLAQSLVRGAERLGRHAESKRIFLRDGRPFKQGETFIQPELAASLSRIAADGREGFYLGETARLIVDEMHRGGGLILLDDLKAYQPMEREPVRGAYRGHQIVSMPPPSSGGTVLIEMLNMIEMSDVASFGHQSSGYVHVVAEAMKRAFADRARYMGDPDFGVVPVAGLTSKEYARKRWTDFDGERTRPAHELASVDPFGFESEETTHFSVVDENGSAVSNTYTLNFGYGSGVTVTGAGFLLNNIMDNFASKQGVPNAYGLIQGEANAIAPGKRPLSSMTPTIVLEEGEVRFVTGTPGGPTIINTVLQTILFVTARTGRASWTTRADLPTPRLRRVWLRVKQLQERVAVFRELRFADTNNGGHRLLGSWSVFSHLDERAVMEDDIGWDALGACKLEPFRAQQVEELSLIFRAQHQFHGPSAAGFRLASASDGFGVAS